MSVFLLCQSADLGKIRLLDEIIATPATLVRTFGAPNRLTMDRDKISGQYAFANDNGAIFVLCDWKTTSLYDSEFPTPDEFWRLDDQCCFSLGCEGTDVSAFKDWLATVLPGCER
jgi:hypothetical protein